MDLKKLQSLLTQSLCYGTQLLIGHLDKHIAMIGYIYQMSLLYRYTSR